VVYAAVLQLVFAVDVLVGATQYFGLAVAAPAETAIAAGAEAVTTATTPIALTSAAAPRRRPPG